MSGPRSTVLRPMKISPMHAVPGANSVKTGTLKRKVRATIFYFYTPALVIQGGPSGVQYG